MRFEKAYIPYGAYWSTPFCNRWQGSFSHLAAIPFAADTARRILAGRGIEPSALDGVALGISTRRR